jgi:hypothetical protein
LQLEIAAQIIERYHLLQHKKVLAKAVLKVTNNIRIFWNVMKNE